MLHRSLRPIALALASFAFLTISSMTLFGAFSAPMFAMPRHNAEFVAENLEFVEPLPPGCINGTPAGEEAPVCCISGFVYFEGREISGAEVTIADAQGIIATVQTQVHEEGLERRPYYTFALSYLSRPVTPTQEITLTVRYSGIEAAPVHHRVQHGGQRRDLVVFDPDLLALAGQTPGQAEPGKFDRARHMATDSQGNLYAIDWLNARIQVFSPEGVLLRIWGEPGSEPDQFSPRGLTGIAIDKRSDKDIVYIGDTSKQRITKHNTDGDLLAVFEPPVERNWAFAAIADIQVDAEGYLYVLAYRGGLFRFKPDGTWLPWPEWPNDFYSAWSTVQLTVTPDGKAYAPNGRNLYRFDEGVPVTLTTSLLAGESLSTTWSIAFNKEESRDYLYVAERPSGTRVIKLLVGSNNDLNQVNELNQVPWNLQPNPSDPPSRFHSLVIHGSNLYITGDANHRIWQFGVADGHYHRSWGGLANNFGQVGDPRGLAISPIDDTLYMADCTTGRINRLMQDQIVQSWDALALGIATTRPFFCPVGLTFDDLGDLLMVDNYHKVTRFITNSGQLVFDGEWGGAGVGINQLINPTSVAIDPNKFIYIADYSNRRIVIAGPAIGPLPAIQTVAIFTGTLPSNALIKPSSIAIDVDESNPNSVTLYIADPGECQTQPGRLLRLTIVQGKIQQDFIQWGPKGWGDTTGPFICPSSVYVRDGYLYATINYQTSNAFYVYKIDKAGKIVATYGTIGWGPGQFLHPIAVAVNSKGEMWVSDTNNSRIQHFKQMKPSPPAATIVHLSAANLAPGEALTGIGAGHDGDANDKIGLYEWSTDAGVLRTTSGENVTLETSAFITEPGKLGPGTHKLRLRVQEQGDEEEWSDYSAPIEVTVARLYASAPPPTQTVPPPLTCPTGKKWTFLLYLAADYSDQDSLYKAFKEAREELISVKNPCVQFGVQTDGPASIKNSISVSNTAVLDTQRWIVRAGQSAEWKGSFEAAMDSEVALAEFLAWGQQYLTADHYYVAIANHGNALQGIAWDHTSDPLGGKFLTAQEIHNALANPRVSRIDILHLDACSMGLLDIGYQLRDKVDYLITSQNIGWSFFAYADYAEQAVSSTTTAQLAQQIVGQYAAKVESYKVTHAQELPYTLAAWNLARVEPVMNGVDALAVLLKAWVRNDNTDWTRHKRLVNTIRNDSLLFNSDDNLQVTLRDEFVDLGDLLTHLVSENVNDEITRAANQLLTELERPDGLILRILAGGTLPPYYRDGKSVDLANASGVSVYFPVQGELRLTLPSAPNVDAAALTTSIPLSYTQLYSRYITGGIYDLPLASRWDEFLVAAYGTPPAHVTLEQPPAPLPPQPLPLSAPPQITVTENLVPAEQQYTANRMGTMTKGDKLLFETTIVNNSNIILTNLVLYQTLPAHLRVVNDIVSHAANVDGQGLSLSAIPTTTVTFLIGSLASHEQGDDKFVVEVVADPPVDPFAGVFFQLRADQLALTTPKELKVQYNLYLPLVNR